MATDRPLLASELFALAHDRRCQGELECHWCGGPCRRELLHDDEPPVVLTARVRTTALRPHSPYQCVGCWLWRRRSVTAAFLSGGLKDRQAAKDHSWWITEERAWALREDDWPHLLPLLLKPPARFVLALRTEAGPETLLQLCRANDPGGILADTPLHFTVDNVPMTYTTYELEEASKFSSDGTEPGVRELVRFLGVVPTGRRPEDQPNEYEVNDHDPLTPAKPQETKRGRGRPPAKTPSWDASQKIVQASGDVARAG